MTAAPTSLQVNGRPVVLQAPPATPLLYLLRNDLGLKAAKYGCGQGQCGACTVLVDGRPVPSCDTPLWAVQDRQVQTLEGLAGADGRLHALQQAFLDEQAAQCGYCTAGMLMAAAGLLQRTPRPTRAQAVQALERQLCRCGSHLRILRAIERAAGAPAAP